jgi:hypothetical protein
MSAVACEPVRIQLAPSLTVTRAPSTPPANITPTSDGCCHSSELPRSPADVERAKVAPPSSDRQREPAAMCRVPLPATAISIRIGADGNGTADWFTIVHVLPKSSER